MSSTGRLAKRAENDHYVTPAWAIDDFLDAWLPTAEAGMGRRFH